MTRARSLSQLANSNVFTVDSTNSRVGIGSTIPDVKLDVDGNMNVSGTLTYEDVTNVDTAGITTTGGLVVTGLGATIGGITTFFGDINFGGAGVGGTVTTLGNAEFAGIVTAVTFDGNVTGNISGGTVAGSTGTFTNEINTAGNSASLIINRTIGGSAVAIKVQNSGSDVFRVENDGSATFAGDVTIAGITTISGRTKISSAEAITLDNNAHTGETLFLRSGGTAGAGNTQALIAFGKADSSSHRTGSALGSIQTDSDPDRIGLAFYTSPGSSSSQTLQEKLRITHAGNIGINSTNPAYLLDIASGSASMRLNSTSTSTLVITSGTSNAARIEFGDLANNDTGYIYYDNSDDSMQFATNGSTERLRITSAGVLQFASGGNLEMASNGRIFVGNGGNATNPMFANVSDTNTGIAFPAADTMMFATGGGERLRITSAGDVVIGTGSQTTPNTNNGNVSRNLQLKGSNNLLFSGICGNADRAVIIEALHDGRSSTERFAQINIGTDGSDNGSITFWTAPYNSGVTARLQIDHNGHVLPQANNTYDLGGTGNRWRNIYSADLQLSNEGSANDVDGTWGNYTIQEGENDLFLLNRRSGKKYKFMLEEVN